MKESASIDKPQNYWKRSCHGEDKLAVCDVVLSLIDTKTDQEAVRVALVRQVQSGRYGVLIKVPLGYRLDTGTMLRVDSKEILGLSEIKFSRCLPDGCYAEKQLAINDINAVKNAKKLEVVLLDLSGKVIVVDIPAIGLKTALKDF